MASAAAARPYSCDPCVHLDDATTRTRCQSTDKAASCTPNGCAWYAATERTLGMQLAMRTPSGWGNYWPLVRLLHLLAAALGRRLVLSSVTYRSRTGTLREAMRRLPSKQLALGGTVPWLLDGPDAEAQILRSVVLSEKELLRGLPSFDASHGRRATDALVRPHLLQQLSAASDATHLWLNLSTWRVQQLLAAGVAHANPPYYLPECPRGGAPHQLAIAACIDRFVTTPKVGSQLAERYAALHRQLPADGSYIGVHVRTMASDFRPISNWSATLRGVLADAKTSLRLLAWDMGTNVSEYATAWRAVCRGGPPLYVASDSRAAVRALVGECPDGQVLTAGSRPKGHLADPLDAPLLDWIAISEAGGGCGRWGHDSSFMATAVMRGRFCSGKMLGLLPKPWGRRRRIHTFTLWANLRRAAICYDLDPTTCTRGRQSRATKLHAAGFPDTPCAGLRAVRECAQLLHSGLLSSDFGDGNR